jgi:hypothetical protein
MNKTEQIKQWLIAGHPNQFLTKELRSKQYKAIAERFGVSWQTVVGIYQGVKHLIGINSKKVEFPKHSVIHKTRAVGPSFKMVAPEPFLKGDPKNVLVIGDVHEPFSKEGYLEFCREMQEKYNCGTVVHIGDAVDNHAVSYHDSDPSGRSAGDEWSLAKLRMKRWYHTFPKAKVCIGRSSQPDCLKSGLKAIRNY